MIRIAKILVAIDFGEPSIAALAYGRELARTFGGRLHVMHVVDTPMMMAGPDGAGIDLAILARDLEQRAQQALDAVITAEDRQLLSATTIIARGSSPAREIVREASEANVDIVVIGTHGRGMMGHLLMGNVAEKVVRMAPCPVLTVRHPEHEFIAPDALQLVDTQRKP